MEKIKDLKQLFIYQLNNLYYTKQLQVENLTQLKGKANSSDLNEEINNHLHESNHQIDRLNTILTQLNEMPVEGKSPAIEGLIEEEHFLMDACKGSQLLDSVIIKSLLEINHYEIANYNSACIYATKLGYEEISSILNQSLQEEISMDLHLNERSKGQINKLALRVEV